MTKPTGSGSPCFLLNSFSNFRAECFYSREGKWYYAGQYIAIRLDELNVNEWEELDQEVTSILVLIVYIF